MATCLSDAVGVDVGDHLWLPLYELRRSSPPINIHINNIHIASRLRRKQGDR